MKRNNKKIIIAIFIFVLSISCFNKSIFVKAGVTNYSIIDDNNAFELNENWYSKSNNKNISIVDKKIHFSKNADYSDTLIFTTYPEPTDLNMPILTLETTVSLTEVIGNKSFGVYFSIPGRTFDASNALSSRNKGSTYVALKKDGGNYTLFAKFYDGEEINLNSVNLGINNKVHIYAEQYYNKRLVIKYGVGDNFNTNELLYDSNGTLNKHEIHYIGFGERGETDNSNYAVANVSHLLIKATKESLPENTNICENFDRSYVNAEEIYTHGELVFKDDKMIFLNSTHSAYIGTMYQYSNFEMSFDIPDMQRSTVYKNGVLNTTVNNIFGIAFGVNAGNPKEYDGLVDVMSGKKEYTGFFLYFDGIIDGTTGKSQGTRICYGHRWETRHYLSKDEQPLFDSTFDIWSEENDGRILQTKFVAKDDVFTLYLKWQDQDVYTQIMSCDLRNYLDCMPTGYITVCAGPYAPNYSQKVCNFSIDNLKIINYDSNPNLIQVGFKKSGYNNVGDYNYIDTRDPSYLLSSKYYDNNTNANGSVLFIIRASAIALICIFSVVSLIIFISKRRVK